MSKPVMDQDDKEERDSSSWDYLFDELRRLDLLICQEVLRQRSGRPANPLEPFKGLVLTEEEIAGLLTDTVGLVGEERSLQHDDPGSQRLEEALSRLECQIQERRDVSLKEGAYLSLAHLSHIFHLAPFEEQCLLICLAPELDRKYEKLYAYLQDDVTRKKPGVDLILRLLCPAMQEKMAARLAFDPQAPLLKFRLLEMTGNSLEGPTPLISSVLKLDDRIVNFLLGFRQMDARLQNVARLTSRPDGMEPPPVPAEVRAQVGQFVHSHLAATGADRRSLVFHFHGPYGSGKESLARAAAGDLGLPLVIGDIRKMLDGPLPFEETLWLLGREAVLQSAALCLENFDHLLGEEDPCQAPLKMLLEVVRTFSPLTFLLGSQVWKPQGLFKEVIFIELEFPIPDDKARKNLWERYLEGCDHRVSHADLGELSGKFRFTPGQIRDALAAARNRAGWRSPDDRRITIEDLYAACRAQSNPKLGALARKLDPKYTWDDIMLPDDQMVQLKEVCNQARYRHLIFGEWGFDRKLSLGKGLNVLFSGPPGTGKSMAGEVIANDLKLDLYKIDLSQVVSKYIGETEKNLHLIFREAQSSHAILFFDEADALFGKRSEVKDSHDRYANIEVAYLLQKMEEYDGIAILATNLRQHIDEAFVRRMQAIVEFPFPDETYRRRIWAVVFPSQAPLAEDIDFDLLAREVKLAGGNIKNIALQAAFYAAEDGRAIAMQHLIRATRREFQKIGRVYESENLHL